MPGRLTGTPTHMTHTGVLLIAGGFNRRGAATVLHTGLPLRWISFHNVYLLPAQSVSVHVRVCERACLPWRFLPRFKLQVAAHQSPWRPNYQMPPASLL